MSTTILSAFNTHLESFLDDMLIVLPSNQDLKTIKVLNKTLSKTKPSVIIKMWKIYVADKYGDEINISNIDFFLGKDYKDDLEDNPHSKYYLDFIDKLRKPISLLHDDDKKSTVKYIQNLSKMSKLY
jgi:hypothetical protein